MGNIGKVEEEAAEAEAERVKRDAEEKMPLISINKVQGLQGRLRTA